MRVNKGKCRVLHLGRTNPKYQLGADLLENSSAEKDLGVLVNDNWQLASSTACGQEGLG